MTGIAAGLAILVGVGLGWRGVVVIGATIVCVAALRGGRVPAVACLTVVLLGALGAWRANGVEHPPSGPAALPTLKVAQVIAYPEKSGRFQHFVVEEHPNAAEKSAGHSVTVCVTAGAMPEVHLGDLLRLSGEVELASDAGLNERAYLTSRSCSFSMYAVSTTIVGSIAGPSQALSQLRARIGDVLRASAPGDAGVLLNGLVTGDDDGFSVERDAALVSTATTHLTAVSGSNLAFVAGIVGTIGAATVGRHRMAWQVATVGIVWSYALISGMQPPAVRAAIVATAAIVAFRFGRRPDFVTLIMLAAGIMVLADPRQVDSLGFRLSVAASLALATVLPMLMVRRGSVIVGILTATTAAQIATLPFLLPIFGTASLLGVPSNALVAPFVALAMPLALCAGMVGLVAPPLAEIIAAPATLAANAMLVIVDAVGSTPGYVHIGVPPRAATLAIAATAGCLVAVMSSDVWRVVNRIWTAWHAASFDGVLPSRREPNRAGGFVELERPGGVIELEGLAAAAPPLLRGKDPADALARDP